MSVRRPMDFFCIKKDLQKIRRPMDIHWTSTCNLRITSELVSNVQPMDVHQTSDGSLLYQKRCPKIDVRWTSNGRPRVIYELRPNLCQMYNLWMYIRRPTDLFCTKKGCPMSKNRRPMDIHWMSMCYLGMYIHVCTHVQSKNRDASNPNERTLSPGRHSADSADSADSGSTQLNTSSTPAQPTNSWYAQLADMVVVVCKSMTDAFFNLDEPNSFRKF
jgi:hypothetical protein